VPANPPPSAPIPNAGADVPFPQRNIGISRSPVIPLPDAAGRELPSTRSHLKEIESDKLARERLHRAVYRVLIGDDPAPATQRTRFLRNERLRRACSSDCRLIPLFSLGMNPGTPVSVTALNRTRDVIPSQISRTAGASAPMRLIRRSLFSGLACEAVFAIATTRRSRLASEAAKQICD